MRGLLSAIGFLTVVPVGRRCEPKEGEWGRAVVWFPVVGLLIGLVLAGVDWCGRSLWDAHVAAALVVGTAVVVTGGLHLDGLMDTADGLFSWQSRERMLEIMRDPRSGALGVAAGATALLVKFACLGHLAGAEHWRVIAAAPVMGRVAMVSAVALFPYARESGTGARFAAEVGVRHAVGAMIFGAALAVGLLRLEGLAVFGAALALAVVCGAYVGRRVGGLTGDVYGAVNEVVEVLALLAGALVLDGQM